MPSNRGLLVQSPLFPLIIWATCEVQVTPHLLCAEWNSFCRLLHANNLSGLRTLIGQLMKEGSS